MWKKAVAFLLQISYISHHVRALQRGELFPYGTLSGDLTLDEGDDETSKVIALSKPMYFYDTSFSKLYVATNGIISPHDLPMEKQYVDDGFPTEFPVISPFLADIDTSNGNGAIYYRQTESPSVLNRVAAEVQKGFPDIQFTPTHAIIATWENVAAYKEVTRTSESPRQVNTFQAVVAYDEENTYTIFLYPENGLQFFGTRPKEMFNVEIELPARVGFTRGEISYFLLRTEGPYFSLTSNEQSVKNLYQTGNTGVPGVWLFHTGNAYSFNNVIPAAVSRHLPTAIPRIQAPVFQTTPEYPVGEYETEDESIDAEDEYSIDPDFQNPDVTEFPQPSHDASLLNGQNQDADLNHPPLEPHKGDVTLSPDLQTDDTSPTNDPPEEIVHPVREHTILEAYPIHPEGQVVNVDEVVNFDSGVIHYSTDNKETCDRFQQTCSQNSYCVDYPSGYCCHCHAGFYGNGRHCLPDGAPQRVNGKVSGKVSVGLTPVGLDNIDLHAYIVVGDGRAYTAISEVPEPLGWALMPVTPIGGLFGWLFALKLPNSHNGFNVTGAEFTRHADVTFNPGKQRLIIVQTARGMDSQNYLNVETYLEGSVPFVPPGASIQMEPFSETYQYHSSLITSKSVREFTIISAQSGAEKFTYQLRQNITYRDCRHVPHAGTETLQLNVERIFAMYVKEERVLRYAITNKIGHVGDYVPGPEENPCYVGSHDCDTTAQCVPGEGQHFTCVCATGYTGDGRNCYDVDECAEGLSSCGSHAQCVNLPGSHSCQCQSGFEHGHDSRTCIDVDECRRQPCHPDASCTDTVGSFHCRCHHGFHGDGFQCHRLHTYEERPKTPCEQHRDSAQSGVDGLPVQGAFVPQCDEEGRYRSQQCHGSTGHCWCVDSRGQERAGTRTPPGTPPVNCDVPERPKTQCEQHRDRVQNGAVVGAFIPQCDDEGHYRSRQCHGSTGHCWCVDSRGQERAGTRTLPGTPAINCDAPERPKTQCEQHRHSAQGGADGVPLVGAFVPECDEEGNYRSRQCHPSTGHCWCVDSRGQERAGTRTPPGTPPSNCDAPERPKTQCEQHRHSAQHGADGVPLEGAFIPQCDEEGRYRSRQCHPSTGHCWCVDSRGQERAGTRTPPGTPPSNCDAPERPKTQCEQHRDNVQDRPGGVQLAGAFIPQCDEEGRYRSRQCHASTGHCWCVDSRGQERAGTRTPPGTPPRNCDAPERPKTQCEQHRHSAQYGADGVPLEGAFIPQCDEEGRYRSRQCHPSTGHCWCVDSRGQERAGTRTPPGTPPSNCDAPERPKTQCEQHRDNVQDRPGGVQLAGAFIPQCDEEGRYRSRQCHASTGHCWCVDSRGQERAGTRTPPGTPPSNCDAPERPKTQCEQHRHSAQYGADGVPLVGAFIPQCDEEGRYRSRQCHASTGHCWCVDSRGQERAGTRTPPGTPPSNCDAPERPKTQCEQHRHSEQHGADGVPVVGAFIPQCDEEGHYRSLQCHGSTGHCWCVDSRGQERAGTRTQPDTPPTNCDAPERPKTPCEQHRDNVQDRPGGVQLAGAFIPQCDEEGRYRSRQCHASTGHCWCVDSRGQERAGTRTPPGTPPRNCDAPERPKTQCEQHRHSEQHGADGVPVVGAFIPQCDEEGHYRSLQCHASTGHCWCVDSRGHERAGTRTQPGTPPTNCDAPERPKTPCEQHRDNVQDRPGGVQLAGAFIPQCDEEGRYRSRQCHASTGHCWCVDSRGQERAGTRTPPGTPPRNCDAPERPKTQCEQHRHSAQHGADGVPVVGAFIPQCDEEGRYRYLQCHGSTGHCWCVDSRGQERAGTRTPPGTPPTNCDAPEHPKTQCEQHRDTVQAGVDGLPVVGAFVPECNEEGHYKSQQCHGSTGHCWCVDSKGQERAGTRTPPGTSPRNCDIPERPKTQCEQQRDSIHGRGDGLPVLGAFVPQCDEEGHYKSLQCHGSTGHCWCVDSRGQERAGTRTPPGTPHANCDAPVHIEHPKTPCEQHRERAQSQADVLVGAFIPQCDEKGQYRSLQCHGSTGHCWCVDSRGQERAGTRTAPGTSPRNCDIQVVVVPTQRPETVCERWRASLMEHYGGHPGPDHFLPQCDASGEFTPVQCYGETSYCWCVDKDGREVPGTRSHDKVKPACIPTVPPPTMRPLPRPDVTPPPSGTSLLYAQGQQIGALPLNGTRMDKERSSVLLALHGSIVVGIDYDCRERKVYWTDLAGRTISRAALEPGSEPEILINTGLMSPEGLAVDVARRRMFWVDSTPDRIETAKLDGSDRRVLFSTDLVNPRAIIVDSLSGTLYWTDWNREAPKIESSTVEGHNRRVLVRDGIGLPNALTIDPTTRRICWADAGTKHLECIAPDGTGRRVIHSNLNYPFSMVFYTNHFYYTDWRRDGVIGLSRDSSHFTDEYLPDQRSHLYGITVASSSCL